MGDTGIIPFRRKDVLERVEAVLNMEIVRLKLWSIKFNTSFIMLEGFVRSEEGTMIQKVCSENICKRISSTVLFDESGRFFELAGQIDREYQQKMGMPSRMIDEFINGFPENWADLINACVLNQQRSALRPIQAAPKEPLRTRAEPIVTLADETELIGEESKKDMKRREREEQREREQEKKLATEKERKRQEAAAVEKKRREEEEAEEAANFTFRVPQSQSGEAITPIRFKRGNGKKGENTRTIFDKTPVRQNSSGPLASSTPQAPPPQHPRRLSNIENNQPLRSPSQKTQLAASIPERETKFASDADLFAVPKLPPSKTTRPSTTSAVSSEGALDFFDEIDALFDTAIIEQTPTRDRKSRRPIATSPSPDPRRRSLSRDRKSERYGSYESSRYTQRYNDDYDNSRMSRRDVTFKRHEGGRDDSRMSRKRGYYRSPDDFEYSRRRDDREKDYYAYDSRHDTKRSRPRETSSSSGRSVRFEDDYRRRGGEFRESKDSRDFRDYDDHRNRKNSGEHEDKKKLKDILRREKELLARLQKSQKSSSSRRDSYSSEEETFDMADEWERENQEIMDNSMMFGDGLSKKKNRRSGGGGAAKKQLARTSQSKPHRKPAQPRKKTLRDPLETDDLNDSIASHRPRRACVTPSTPAPKKISWPRRDLDRLKHVIELMKPTTTDKYWIEVTRLLAKEGVDPEAVKQIAVAKLKWKEPVQNEEVLKKDEEEEKKRRRGAVARIKEGVKMHEELREGGDKKADDLESGVEAMEDYQPEDVAADQSLLALGTPIAAKKKGGTRASIMPKPVEDSPMAARGSNSTFNSPILDQTKAKEVETTLKYVQHLSMMQARPSSRANKSYLNKSSTRGSRNTSMSLEQGTRKAMKIINRGRTIQEDDEEDDEEDEDDEFDEQDGNTSIY